MGRAVAACHMFSPSLFLIISACLLHSIAYGHSHGKDYHSSLDAHHHLDHHHGHSHKHDHAFGSLGSFLSKEQLTSVLSARDIWYNTLGSVFLVSVAPLMVLYMIPDLRTHPRLLKILLGVAAGGLLSDAFLHLIPKSITQDSNSNSDRHSGLWVISGIITFLSFDMIVRILTKKYSGHGHSHSAINSGNSKHEHSKSKSHSSRSQQKKNLKMAGYLNLVADTAHNFTDGLAIGGSFLLGRSVGFVTTLTVLVHELPHEVGDYAILIQSGCSKKKAILLQLTTAIGALVGACLSLLAAGVGLDWLSPEVALFALRFAISPEAVTSTILPFTAGGFLYISLSVILPDLLADTSDLRTNEDTHSNRIHAGQTGILNAFFHSSMEVLALCGGIALTSLAEFFH